MSENRDCEFKRAELPWWVSAKCLSCFVQLDYTETFQSQADRMIDSIVDTNKFGYCLLIKLWQIVKGTLLSLVAVLNWNQNIKKISRTPLSGIIITRVEVVVQVRGFATPGPYAIKKQLKAFKIENTSLVGYFTVSGILDRMF